MSSLLPIKRGIWCMSVNLMFAGNVALTQAINIPYPPIVPLEQFVPDRRRRYEIQHQIRSRS